MLKIQEHSKIIGIDLTGSESKPSGFCLLENALAITRKVRADQQILELVDHFNPDVVSIDSPLSLPFGRISPFDDDPGRNLYGINRSCERQLLARGIRSYPPLIPSMQKLTQRGIKLADALRTKGFTVIESFPGGAQDILGIPRKSKGLEQLKNGLSLLGISGEYIQAKVSHDEIDAITCALVGLFFLRGQFEALGNEQEGYLIVPRL
ncbi:DUF429 domain-containing protein [Dyadobacter subterraneus]|uniref:DUF429 domain-containing protein n=1 Tax=Dyadobacter subterraneus TaxID=2773304 RepID=A0ABR9WEH5_9BACT|nr:DUF429 domain-containing protein [Dyadobacter subterraneus]MBE9463803.1 DUF429 domain-containing protein [Dyadobacter subterraneus]